MTSTLAVDASALVALLVDDGRPGRWVAEQVRGRPLAAPDLVLVETASVLRRLQAAGRLERAEATLAHRDLLDLSIQLWPYEVIAARSWELREALTIYDATYVAVAESAGAALLTLDARLVRAPGPTCEMLTPPA